MPVRHHSVFTGRMPFLPPNQQCQINIGIKKLLICVHITITTQVLYTVQHRTVLIIFHLILQIVIIAETVYWKRGIIIIYKTIEKLYLNLTTHWMIFTLARFPSTLFMMSFHLFNICVQQTITIM